MIHRSSAAGDDMVRTGALLTSRECRWLRSRAMSLPSGAAARASSLLCGGAARASSLPCGGAARGRFRGSRSARGRPAHNHCTLVCPRRASDLLPGAPAQRAGRAGLRRLRPPGHRAERDFGVFGRPLRHGGIPSNGRDGPASDAFALPPIGRDGTSASSDGPSVTAAARALSLPCGGAARGRFCGSRSARGRPAHNHCTLVCPRRAGRAGLRRLRPPAYRAGRGFGVFGRPLRHGGIPPGGRDEDGRRAPGWRPTGEVASATMGFQIALFAPRRRTLCPTNCNSD